MGKRVKDVPAKSPDIFPGSCLFGNLWLIRPAQKPKSAICVSTSFDARSPSKGTGGARGALSFTPSWSLKGRNHARVTNLLVGHLP